VTQVAVNAAWLIVNVCVTDVASVYEELPACEAVITQLPAPVVVSWFPVTEQGPVTAYDTVNPLDAVAPSVIGVAEYVTAANAPGSSARSSTRCSSRWGC